MKESKRKSAAVSSGLPGAGAAGANTPVPGQPLGAAPIADQPRTPPTASPDNQVPTGPAAPAPDQSSAHPGGPGALKAGPWAQPDKVADITRPEGWEANNLVLSSEEELKIYVNRQRMRLVDLMTTLGRPATAKMLSDRMGISASSVKHHLDKLRSIGVVEVDHQAHIHGILATYYRVTDRNIVLDSTDPALQPFTERIVQDSFDRLLQGTLQALTAWQADPDATWDDAWGLMETEGAIFLTREEANALRRQILDFLEAHKTPHPGAAPIHFGLISYRAEAPVKREG